MSHLNRRQLLAAAGLTAAGATAASALPASAESLAGQSHPPHAGKSVTTGADRAAANSWSVLAGKKVGIVTNPTGVLSNLRSIVDEMHASGKVNIVGVFGPEHGFRGTAQAGGSEGTYVDARTGITVYDAYGAGITKMTEMFRTSGVETVVFDIQDAGSRFYTYIWTLYTSMLAAVGVDADFVVFDRPNPTGATAFGPMMTSEYTSGVGAKEIVQAHGMTMGELARFYDGEFLPKDTGKRLKKLTVVGVKGWRRDVRFAETGLTWVTPSPNMPTPDTALLYAGTGMFEGTNLSEGRGTTRPFELIGAPYVDYKWAERLATQDIPGVEFREVYFTPTFNKYVGEVCGGVQVHIADPAKIDPVSTGVHMLVALKSIYPAFAWRKDTYDPARPYWIDKLTGSTRLRDQITAGAPASEVIGSWQTELTKFKATRRQYLIYRGPGF